MYELNFRKCNSSGTSIGLKRGKKKISLSSSSLATYPAPLLPESHEYAKQTPLPAPRHIDENLGAAADRPI